MEVINIDWASYYSCDESVSFYNWNHILIQDQSGTALASLVLRTRRFFRDAFWLGWLLNRAQASIYDLKLWSRLLLKVPRWKE